MLPISMDEVHEIIKDSSKDIIQDALETELDKYSEYEKHQTSESRNSSKGDSLKIAKGIFGKMDLKLPRDRDANFKLKIPPQHKKRCFWTRKKGNNILCDGNFDKRCNCSHQRAWWIHIGSELY